MELRKMEATAVTNNKIYCNRYCYNNSIMRINIAYKNTSDCKKNFNEITYVWTVAFHFVLGGRRGGSRSIILHFFYCCYCR